MLHILKNQEKELEAFKRGIDQMSTAMALYWDDDDKFRFMQIKL